MVATRPALNARSLWAAWGRYSAVAEYKHRESALGFTVAQSGYGGFVCMLTAPSTLFARLKARG